jgi:nucleoside-diphosphate-sugar epimerase
MLGQALARHLHKQGVVVTLLVRPDSPRLHAVPASENVRLIPCDLAHLSTLSAEKIGTCDAFFHLGWVGTRGRERDDAALQAQNVQYTLEAVKLAARLQCAVFVGAGSQAEYGHAPPPLTPTTPTHPVTAYGKAKHAAGHLSAEACRAQGIDHVWARILSVYGPGDHPDTMMMSCIQSLVCGEPMAFTAGEPLWDYLYSADAARALARMALSGKNGTNYPLGSGHARPLKEYILEARDVLRPGQTMQLGALPTPPGQVSLAADISPLTRDTGFVPQVPFAEGVRRTANWIKEQTQ